MSLKPPSLWIKPRGRQFRVYWRNTPGLGLPVRSYYGRLYTRGQAELFISMAAHLGVEAACQVMDAPDKATRQALMATALDQRGLVPAGPVAAVPLGTLDVPAATTATPTADDPHLTGVTFRQLWTTFLDQSRGQGCRDPRPRFPACLQCRMPPAPAPARCLRSQPLRAAQPSQQLEA